MRDLMAKYVTTAGVGAYLMLDPQSEDPIVQSYLNGGHQNDYMLDVMLMATERDDRVIDLGCHVGTFSISAAAAGRRILAVDANQFHVDLVQSAARLNNLDNLLVQFGAISATPGFVRFFEEGLFGRIDFDGTREGAVDVPTLTLDSAFDRAGGPVAFLKMDIEGAEYDALLTGKAGIAEHRPIIMFESNPLTLELAGRSVEEFRALLEEWGYKTFRIQGQRWIYAPPAQIQPEAWVDMVAIPNEQQARWTDRIDWTWADDDVLKVCEQWAALPYSGPKAYLARAIRENEASTPEMQSLAKRLAQG